MNQINSQNYDLALKEAFSIFNDKTLEFLGLDLPKITRFLETEFAEIETHDSSMDLNFELEDGSILHFEEEVHLSTDDLIRFARYDLHLYSRYRKTIHTVVLTPATSHPGTKQLDTGTIHYTINQIEFSGKDADKLRKKIEAEISSGGHVNELELIFMPLMHSELSKTALLFEAIKLGKALPDSSERSKVISLTLVMANKLVKPEIIEEIWEEIKMLEIIKYAEQKGVKKGRLEGKIEGRVEGKISLVKRLLQKKFGYLPVEIMEQIDGLSDKTLDTLSVDILDMQCLEDLKKYIDLP